MYNEGFLYMSETLQKDASFSLMKKKDVNIIK